MCVCVYLNNLILKSLEFINMILVFHKKSIYSNSNVHIQFNSYEITRLFIDLASFPLEMVNSHE